MLLKDLNQLQGSKVKEPSKWDGNVSQSDK